MDHAYLGIEFLHRVEPDQVAEAIVHLKKAHEIAPDLVITNLGLGFCSLINYAFWVDPEGDGLDQAYKYAMILESLAPDDAQTYRLLSRFFTGKINSMKRCVLLTEL